MHFDTPARPRPRRLALLALAGLTLLGLPAQAAAAEAPVGLGAADSFAILAGSTVTNTGESTINGDLGLAPGSSVTGFPPGTLNGTLHVNDGVARQAKADLTTAYTDAAGRAPTASTSADLAGQRLTPGVYRAPGALRLSGALTLDAAGDPAAVFIFQVESDLVTASSSRITLVNGAQPCNVFWQVGSSSTLGSDSTFVGTILALTSISLQARVTVQGRTLARNGAVTLIDDTITRQGCATPTSGGTTSGGTTSSGTTPTGTTATPAATRGSARITATRATGGRSRVTVTGRRIRRVVFVRGGRVIATRPRGPFVVTVAPGGSRTVTARITFTDGTPPTTRKVRLPAPRTPSRLPRAPGGFTG